MSSTIPLPPREQLCIRYCCNKHTHTHVSISSSVEIGGPGAFLARERESPALPVGGLQIPEGLVVRSCTSHPGVLGSIPKREEPGKTGRHPVLKYGVPHGSYLNINGCGVVASPMHAPPRTPLLLPLLLSYPFPPRSLVRDVQSSSPHTPQARSIL